MKFCNKCKRELDESEFNKCSSTRDGLKTLCKDCCKEYRLKIREQRLIYNKEYNQRDYVKQQKKNYYNANKNQIILREKQKRQHNQTYYINTKTLKAFASILSGRLKNSSYFNYLNYSAEDFRKYIESQFDEHMDWTNYGEYWEIDHIIPQVEFHFNSIQDKQYKICWSLLNLRPMLISSNRHRPEDGSDIPEELKYKILHQFDGKEE